MEKAKAAAVKAVRLDPTLAKAHATLGWIKTIFDWDFSNAQSEFHTALKLSPQCVTARYWYSAFLQSQDKHEEPIIECQRVLDLDPLSALARTHMVWRLIFTRRCDEALQQLQTPLQEEPNSGLLRMILGIAVLGLNAHAEAIEALEATAALLKRSPLCLGFLGFAYGVSGDRAKAESLTEELEMAAQKGVASFFALAMTRCGLGDRPAALAYLHQAVDARDPMMPWAKLEHCLESLHPEPEFKRFLARMAEPNPVTKNE